MDKEPTLTTPPVSNGKKKWLIVGIVALIVIVGAVAFYVLVFMRPQAESTSDTSSSNTDSPKRCGLTQSTTEGPYYVAGTTELIDGNLNYANLPGEPIKISGYVYAGDKTNNPVTGAKIDIWQADSDGKYHPQGNGPASLYTATQLALRGYVITDEKGRYEFSSIYPGEYEGRPRHIHARASADGFTSVTTQLIAPKSGDKVSAAQDSIARELPSCNTLVFDKGSATFDFHLQ
jgi:protocatechuate 3,4-dioxygenase beta subunit